MVKVLVGCPTSAHKAYCLEAYAAGLAQLRTDGVDVLLVDNSPDDDYLLRLQRMGIPAVKGPCLPGVKERIVASRMILRDYALREGYDYLLSLEQDVVPPADVIEKLLGHQKAVVSGVVFTKYEIDGQMQYRPLVWGPATDGDPEKMQFMDDAVWKPGLYSLKACGLGCVLIRRDVLEQVPFRLFTDLSTFDDIPFCKDVVERGFGLYADTSVRCKHFVEKMDWEGVLAEERAAKENAGRGI